MTCTHTVAEMDTAAHADGLCPLCLKDRLAEQCGKTLAAQYQIEQLQAEIAQFNRIERELARLVGLVERVAGKSLATIALLFLLVSCQAPLR